MFVIKERYDSLSEDSQSTAEKLLHLGRYHFIKRSLHNKRGKVLDIGCGYGYGSFLISDNKNLQVYGVDISKSSITIAKKRYSSLEGSDNLKFEVGDLRKLSFPSEYFDFIFCFETIEHLTLGGGKIALAQLSKVLKKGGTLFISTPNRNITQFIKFFMPSYNNPFHLHEYNLEQLKALLYKNGLTIEKEAGQYLFIPIIYLLTNRFGLKLEKFFYPIFTRFSFLYRYLILIAKKTA